MLLLIPQVRQIKTGTFQGKLGPLINLAIRGILQLHAEFVPFPYICGKDKGIASLREINFGKSGSFSLFIIQML